MGQCQVRHLLASFLLLSLLLVTVSARSRKNIWQQLSDKYGYGNGGSIAFNLQLYGDNEAWLKQNVQTMKQRGQLHNLCRYVEPKFCDVSPNSQGLFLYIQQTLTSECCSGAMVINGNWGLWASWTPCSVSCGRGTRSRSRQCNNPAPSNGGQFCSGDRFQTQSCNRQNCFSVINGNWGLWASWTSCSVSCGRGSRSRSRQCNNPAPSSGGQFCFGAGFQTQSCNHQTCAALTNGNWGLWASWTSCSVSCGRGSRSRSRQCNNPAPSSGGQFCFGAGFQTQSCNPQNCFSVINGNWGLWAPWTSCSVNCGGGSRSRARQCNNPAPSSGGQFCFGAGFQTQSCNPQNCVSMINGNWGLWASWTSCSMSCGGGTRSRSRQCNNPAPSSGGQSCSGNGRQTESCNTQNCQAGGRQCSQTQFSAGRVMGGSAAFPGQYPWLVHLVVDNEIRCAGSILDKYNILTASHCLDGTFVGNRLAEPGRYEILAGQYNRTLTKLDPSAQRISVIAGVRHENFDSRFYQNDVAILRLSKPLMFNNFVTKVCLPSATDTLPSTCVVAGWGSLSFSGGLPQKLQHVELNTYDNNTCLTLFQPLTNYDINSFLSGGVMCASNGTSGGKDSCRGDSGSALMCRARDAQGQYYKIFGVVSNGFGCGRPGQPGYYAYVPYYLDWIASTIRSLYAQYGGAAL